MARKKPLNPFYLLLVVVGTAFVITASAYGVMATRALRPPRVVAGAEPAKSPLLTFMEAHGEKLLVGELLVLALATVGAISTDGYWAKRAAAPPPDATTDDRVIDDKVKQG